MRITFLLVLALFAVSAPRNASAQMDLKVEGIVFEGENSDNSYAVVDGNFLKKGDTYQGYKITSVESTSVRAVDEKTGKEKQFHITGGEPSSFLPPIPQAPGSRAQSKPGTGEVAGGPSQQEANPLAQMFEQLRNMLGLKEDGSFQFPGLGGSDVKPGSKDNPFAKFINIAWEVKAMVELKNIYQMSAAYYVERNTPPKDLGELVQNKMLSQEFSDSQSGPYRFYIKASSQELEVHADPVDSSSGLRYFMLSEQDGSMRVERGKPATSQSPAATPSSMMPWLSK